MHTVDLVIGCGWLAFWLYWLIAAFGAKAGRTAWRRFAGFRLVVIVVIVALVRAHAFRGHTTHGPWPAGVGIALVASGFGLAVWARIHLGRNWGEPMSEKYEPELVTTGPYHWIRNPIYSGIILAMIGTAIAVNLYGLAIAAVLGGYFVYSAVMEQRFMEARFPDTYPAYRSATKMLVPFVF